MENHSACDYESNRLRGELAQARQKIERLREENRELRAVLCDYFSINPDTSDGTELIGRSIVPFGSAVNRTIIRILQDSTKAAAESAKGKA